MFLKYMILKKISNYLSFIYAYIHSYVITTITNQCICWLFNHDAFLPIPKEAGRDFEDGVSIVNDGDSDIYVCVLNIEDVNE